MAKFIIETYEDKNINHFYVTFETDKFDGAEEIAEELNIPVEEYFRICRENGAYVVPSMSNDQEMFGSVEQAKTCLQELLEFSIEFNKNNQCNYEEDYSDIIPSFPQDFISDNEEIPNEQINEIIKNCIIELEENEEADGIDITKGNTMVLVSKNCMCDNPECADHYEYYYTVTVCKNIYEYDSRYNLEDE